VPEEHILEQPLIYKSLRLVLRDIVNLYHEATIDDKAIHQSNTPPQLKSTDLLDLGLHLGLGLAVVSST
jgi:hypothetical protein